MKKPFSPEQIKSAIQTMRDDPRFVGKENMLIIQQSRLARLEEEMRSKVITSEDRDVELNQLFYALRSLARSAGVNNFMQLVGLDEVE